MSKTNNKIPFSTTRQEIRKLMRSPRQQANTLSAVKFVPTDLKIWTGRDSDFFVRSFCHHRMILKIILSGNATTNIDGIRYQLKPADAVLYFPMQAHSTETNDSGIFEYLAITFVSGMGSYETLDVLKNRVFSPDPDNSFLVELVRAWQENQTLHAICILTELLAAAVARFTTNADCPDSEFGQIAEYIRKNCRNELSVKNIAAQFDISTQSVRRIFQRNISGLTPAALIRQQKMILAEELLRNTQLSLQEIARQCGFATEFSFSRAFKRKYGVPPVLYRKSHQ